MLLSVTVVLLSAFLSAFLDALSVAAVLVSVCTGILGVYFHVLSVFAPQLNLNANPLWGRNMECPGEDPYLTSVWNGVRPG